VKYDVGIPRSNQAINTHNRNEALIPFLTTYERDSASVLIGNQGTAGKRFSKIKKKFELKNCTKNDIINKTKD